MPLNSAKILLRVSLCCCALAGALKADQFGNVIFEPPSGWKRVPQPDGVAFARTEKDLRDAVILFILPDQELRNDFRAAFTSIVQSQLKKGERLLKQSEPQLFPNNTGVKSLFEILIVQDATGREAARVYTGFNVGNRIDVVGLAAPNQDAFRDNQPVLKEFISHLQFTAVTQNQ